MSRLSTLIAHRSFRYLLAAIWLVNGLFCKILDLVPRHQRIVAAILGEEHGVFLTRAIGASEMLMALWVLSGWRYRWCAVVQIAVIACMNIIEFVLVPDLLLWGRLNAFFALLLCALIYVNAFCISKQTDL